MLYQRRPLSRVRLIQVVLELLCLAPLDPMSESLTAVSPRDSWKQGAGGASRSAIGAGRIGGTADLR